jgi:hypothetical protein
MESLSEKKVERISQFLTTEHFTLQGARSGTISESNGRLGAYLSTVSMSIVALAFIAQVSGLGTVFLTFSIIIFPILIFVGVGTWARLIQLGVTDVLLAQAINRIRHYYLELVPESDPYFSFPHFDDPESVRVSVLPVNIAFEGFGSAGFQVTAINSILVGVFAGILASGALKVSSGVSVVVGIAGLVLAFGIQAFYSTKLGARIAESMEVRFPVENRPDTE